MRLPDKNPRAPRFARPMALLSMLVAMSLAAGCGGVQYRDTNAAVDANPLCASAPSQPGEPVSKDCERVREATWNSDDAKKGEPLDFSGKKD
jgi:hypothetical protein